MLLGGFEEVVPAFFVDFVFGGLGADEPNGGEGVGIFFEEASDGVEGAFGGGFLGELLEAGANGGEGEDFDTCFEGGGEGVVIAEGKEFEVFVACVGVPDGPDDVDDLFGGKSATASNKGVANLQRSSFLQHLLAGGLYDFACFLADAVFAYVGGVGAVDDSFCGEVGYALLH